MTSEVVILDGYTDEPAVLGVPPYIAPLPRYLFGALTECHIQPKYYTIDQARTSAAIRNEIKQASLFIIIAGALLPGKYIRGLPISYREIPKYARLNANSVLGGSVAAFGYYNKGTNEFFPPQYFQPAFKHIIGSDLDAAVYDYFHTGEFINRHRTMQELEKWSINGAPVVSQHPDLSGNNLIAELDISWGCVRYVVGGCSYCIEPTRGKPIFRAKENVAAEVNALAQLGVVNYRLGGAACIFSYKALGIGETDRPIPNVAEITSLLQLIRDACPNLQVLHTDNANPALLAAHPQEATQILQSIVRYCTSGNILSFGLESTDPHVYSLNNLKISADECLEAIHLVNEVGRSIGPTGLPHLLPGLNFIYGLAGETKNTYELNYQFLLRVLNQGLLLRRINLRQVLNIRGTTIQTKHLKWFRGHKLRVFSEIEHPMLQRLLPVASVLSSLKFELYKNNLSYLRQIGTYPILVKIPERLDSSRDYSAVILSHNKKSVNGLTLPIRINELSELGLRSIPGIGVKRAQNLLKQRPFLDFTALTTALDEQLEIFSLLKDFLNFRLADSHEF